MKDDKRASKWLEDIEPWGACIVCFTLFLIFASVFIITITDVKYPEERYDTYIDVKEDGFESVNFFFSSNIGSSLSRPVVVREAGIKLLTEMHYPNGFYYRYSVVYRNGTILETEKEYIPFAENRTLLDFDSIELSILQVFSHYGESLEGWNEEYYLLIFTGFGAAILIVAALGFYVEKEFPSNRYKHWSQR